MGRVKLPLFLISTSIFLLITASQVYGQNDTLVYHAIRVDKQHNILPWSDDEPGKAYSKAILAVWNFWNKMPLDMNGLPYYMNHQVWQPGLNDRRGIGGDQLAMALSSWQLLMLTRAMNVSKKICDSWPINISVMAFRRRMQNGQTCRFRITHLFIPVSMTAI